jgi:carbon-monoxide dehydrogenase medium subunit
MYPRAFSYHRAGSLQEASTLLAQLGGEAKLLAGGQSLIPLMKLRFANPAHLVDLNFISGLSYVRRENGTLAFGPMARHAHIEHSAEVKKAPILYDCAAGIADVQVRNQGTIGGSVAEADPSGDWAPVLLTLETEVKISSANGARSVMLNDFIQDAYTTVLAHDELISEIRVKVPGKDSGGAYLAFKRTAPVYATASAAVQLSLKGDTCADAKIYLGAVGLVPVHAEAAEKELRGQPLNTATIAKAAEAAMAAVEPPPDMRGTTDYKRALVGGLVRRAIDIAARRARGERVEASHIYA